MVAYCDKSYEYPHSSVGISEWGSYNFMHSRGEVRSFLQSAANYWLEYYHIDGLRMDTISRKAGSEELVAVFNFSGEEQEYKLPQTVKTGKILLHTDWERYGGKSASAVVDPQKITMLPPFSGVLYQKTKQPGRLDTTAHP